MQARISDQIETLFESLRSKDRRPEALRRAVHLGREEPVLLTGLIKEVLRVLPAGGSFLDILLGFLPDEAWPSLVAAAVEKLTWNADNEAAAQVLRQASLQLPVSTHPHLKSIVQIEERGSHSLEAAFHDAGLEAVQFLLARAAEGDRKGRRFACKLLLETRLPEALEFVRARGEGSVAALLTVGFEETAQGFRRLYAERPLHLAFPAAYLDRLPHEVTQRDQGISSRLWAPAPAGAAVHRLGGSTGADCGVCGKRVPRLLLLSSVPAGIGVTGLDQLELCACLSCLGWEREILHYRHPRGLAEAWGKAELSAPRADLLDDPPEACDLAECMVALVDRGPRARFQDWCTGENLHRVGGPPVWIEDAAYPACPDCGERSAFLLQLDSELLTSRDLSWSWGRGGLCYVFWCDRCRVSSAFWQCT